MIPGERVHGNGGNILRSTFHWSRNLPGSFPSTALTHTGCRCGGTIERFLRFSRPRNRRVDGLNTTAEKIDRKI